MRHKSTVCEVLIFVLLLTLATPTTRGLIQQPPEPVTDTKPVGPPTSEKIATGRYKLTYRNAAGQIVREVINEEAGELINIVRIVSRTEVLKIHTNGKPAQVVTTVFDNQKKLATGADTTAHPGHEEHYRYDRQGNPIEKITYSADDDGKIDRLHREVTTWPSGSGPNGVTVIQDKYPDGSWRDSRFQPKPTEKKTTGTKSVSANPGYTIQNDDSIAGLSAVSLGTPDGKIYLNLPSAISAGATISGTVVDQPDGKTPQEKEQHRINLNRFSLRLGDQPVPVNNGVFRITIPQPTAGEEVPTLHCGFGNRSVAKVTLNLGTHLPSSNSFTIPTGGQEGWPLVLQGPFDGIPADQDSASISNQRLPFMAETSDGFKIVRLTSSGEQSTPPVYGLTTIKIIEQGQSYECPFRRLGLELTSNRPLDLLRGESATIFIKVLGLAQLNQDVPLDIVNHSPEIIKMQGGEEHHRTIRSSDAQGDGTFLMERNVTGVQRGAFNITATISWKHTCNKEATFAAIPEIEKWFDTATSFFRQGRKLADEANSVSGRGEDASALADDALQTLSRARDYVRRALEAGEISERTATIMSEFITRFETEARQAKAQQQRSTVATSVPTPLPASRPSPTPTPNAVVTEGRFEPSQGVWQDDDYFADKPGKQLTRTGSTTWNAELKMVVGRYTGLFGIREDQRSRIRIMGTTNGTRLTRVKFRFTLIQNASRRIVYEEPRPENWVALDGPVGPVQPFEASLSASIGPPDFRPFKIHSAGFYAIEAELIRADGQPTGLKVTVSGEAIETHPPAFKIVPVVLSDPLDQAKELEMEASLIGILGGGIHRLFPVKNHSIRVEADVTQDLRSLEPGTFSSLWSKLPGTADLKSVRVDSLVTAIGQRFATASSLTNGEQIVVLLSKKDFALTRDASEAFAFAASQKVFIIQPGATHFTLAHEFIHQTPFVWSEAQMLAECGKNYHNSADVNYGNGAELLSFEINRMDRQHSVMGPAYGDKTWITQCSYWHLLNYLVKPPDPDLFLVRGYLAKNDQAVVGSFDRFYELQGEADLASGKRSSDGIAIVVRDSANQVLAEYPFTPMWKNPDLVRERTLIPFTFRIPSTPTAYRIELVHKNVVLDQRIVSPHSPTVKISSPAAGASAQPTANGLSVTWQGTDADGDALTYSVYYSPNGGEDWRLVSYEQRNTSFVVPVRGRPRAARVRVIATDGTRSAKDEVAFSFVR